MVMYAERPTEQIPAEPAVEQEETTFPPLPDVLKFPEGFSDQAWRIGALYEEYSRQFSKEGYEQYHEACFMGMLSIVSLRRIRINFGPPDWTPLMVILLSKPGTYKKTRTAKAVREVMHSCGLDFLLESAKVTPQKLIHDMSGAIPKDFGDLPEEKQEAELRRLAFAGQRGMIVGEFGMFAKSMMNESGVMAEYQTIFLEMDDCNPTYGGGGTLSRGKEIVEKPFLSLIGCMTPANIKTLASKDSELWQNGFWSRIAVVCPPVGTSADNPDTEGDIPIPWELTRALKAWHDRLGTPHVQVNEVYETKETKSGPIPVKVKDKYEVVCDELPEVLFKFGIGVYAAWARYRSFVKYVAAVDLQYDDLAASYERLPVKTMRMAALLASLENSEQIELWHWAKAQEISERMRYSLHLLYEQVNGIAGPGSKAQEKLDDILIDILKKYRKQEEPVHPTVRMLQQRERKLKGTPSADITKELKQLIRDGIVEKIQPTRKPGAKRDEAECYRIREMEL
jgi:hypothetical protein